MDLRELVEKSGDADIPPERPALWRINFARRLMA
jgi:hypothetical protein